MFLIFFCSPVWGAKYAGEFLSLGVGARALGMGGAFVAICDDASAGYWNPAGLQQIRQKEIIFMHAETFGSLLNHDFLSYALPLKDETSHSTLSFSLIRLGGGGVKLTSLERDEPISDSNRVILVREASHADYAFLFSYSRRSRSNLAWGASAKVIYRKLADNSAFGMGLDGGVLYSPYDFLTLGANLLDLTATFLTYNNGTTESIYPTLKTGGALKKDFGDFSNLLAIDSDVRFENRRSSAQYWIGSLSFDMHYGFETWYKNRVAGRLGFDQGNLTFGFGLRIRQFILDAAFLNHDQLENSYRISLQVKL
ncbi:MAG: PorV/PorQ family protein, partial [candidate division Zixibacteria bacterium]|nr:PorV/PorQ family protein [candidate division Zixibacteria bacterium]